MKCKWSPSFCKKLVDAIQNGKRFQHGRYHYDLKEFPANGKIWNICRCPDGYQNQRYLGYDGNIGSWWEPVIDWDSLVSIARQA